LYIVTTFPDTHQVRIEQLLQGDALNYGLSYLDFDLSGFERAWQIKFEFSFGCNDATNYN
jgi:hypothetical protein